MVSAIPQHIGVILDGNRRYARALLRQPWAGHRLGLAKAREVLEWTCEAGIKHITAYVLSLENLASRPKRELHFILKCLGEEADAILSNAGHVVHQYRVRVRFIGRTTLLPQALQKKLHDVEERTARYNDHALNVAVAYGGRQELVDAMRSILAKGLRGILKERDLDENTIKRHLYTNGQPYPDFIFRTGGEKRTSNFMPFQAAYAELIFTDKKWPELTHRDFQDALREFAKRKRRFGA